LVAAASHHAFRFAVDEGETPGPVERKKSLGNALEYIGGAQVVVHACADGHVLDLMDNVKNFPVFVQHGEIDRMPVPFAAVARRVFWRLQIVALDVHRVFGPRCHHPCERCAQFFHPGHRVSVAGVASEDLEQTAPDNGTALCVSSAEKSVARAEDGKAHVRPQYEKKTRRTFEDALEIDAGHRRAP